MSTLEEIFGDRALTAGELESALSERGLCLSDRLESALAEERERHDAELSGLRAQSALQLELTRVGAYNPALAIKALSTEGMGGNEAEVTMEARSRVAQLKKAEPYLFGEAQIMGEAVVTGAPHGGSGVDPDSMSDSEYYRTMARI